MREILLDTETTGLSHAQGHRVIEIGCVEMINRSLTGKTYHTYINPERDVPPDASRISGLTTEFLKPFPLFEHVAEEFLDFIEDSVLVIHNAPFDIGFLNAELKMLSKTQLNLALAVDTVKMARKQFPGSPANLDALCRRFSVDLSSRSKHGALVDAHLLAKVYIHLTGGRQRKLFDADAANTETGMRRAHVADSSFSAGGNAVRASRPFPESEEERLAHSNFLESIKDPLWNKIP